MIKLNLEKVLKERDISLYKLEKDTKISYSVLFRYNKGDVQRVDLSVLDRICKVLKIVPSDLLVFENDNNKPTATAN